MINNAFNFICHMLVSIIKVENIIVNYLIYLVLFEYLLFIIFLIMLNNFIYLNLNLFIILFSFQIIFSNIL